MGIVRKTTKQDRCGKETFFEYRKLLSNNFNLNLRIRMIKCFVWSVTLYAAETRTLIKAERKWLEAFRFWIWRRMLC